MSLLKAGVMGAGVFGGFHARKYAGLPGVALTRIYDLNRAAAAPLAADLGVEAFDDLDAFLDGLDVVTVATPGVSHGALALRALQAGAHVYVEKPLAVTDAEADAVLAAAAKAGRVVACGHQERVTFRAMGLFDTTATPLRLESVRRGVPNPRNRDISCVLDLMIHDLDLALALNGGDISGVTAEGAFDEVRAEVMFASGLVAAFEASRVAPARERTMKLAYSSGEVEVDFLAPAFVNRSAVALDPAFAATPAARDPLGASVSAFLDAVQGKGAPMADGAAGARALALARRVEAAAGLGA